MSTDNNGLSQTTEHYLRRVLVGSVTDVRHRLNSVLERLGYDFIDENDFELEARRGARGWANAYASADVLDYPRVLVIKLKQISESSTRASFIYTIKHPSLNRGEKEVLTREAETIATLATLRTMDKMCAVCGQESSDESRFCRKCGTPMTGDETAVEVLRMTAETRSAHTSVVTSSVIAIVTTIFSLVALIISFAGLTGAGVNTFLVMSAVLSFLNIFAIGFAWKRINNSLRSNNNNQKIIVNSNVPNTLPEAETSALPPRPINFSVTDPTTDLIALDEKQYEFIERKKVITKELDLK